MAKQKEAAETKQATNTRPLIELVRDYNIIRQRVTDGADYFATAVSTYTQSNQKEIDTQKYESRIKEEFLKRVERHYAWDKPIGSEILRNKKWRPLHDHFVIATDLLTKENPKRQNLLEGYLAVMEPFLNVPNNVRIRDDDWPAFTGIVLGVAVASTIPSFVKDAFIWDAASGMAAGYVAYQLKKHFNNNYIKGISKKIGTQIEEIEQAISSKDLGRISAFATTHR